MVFGWSLGVKTDFLLRALGCGWLVVVTACKSCLGNGLVGLQQALRADNHAVVGDELLVADVQFFPAFWASPAHDNWGLEVRNQESGEVHFSPS